MSDEKKKEVGTLMLKCVRLSFADTLYVAEAGDRRKDGKHAGKIPYRNSVNFLLPDKASREGKEVLTAIKEKMKEAKFAQWQDKADEIKIKSDRLALRDGDEEEWAGYAGRYYISASRTTYGPKDGATDGPVPKRPYRVIGPRKVKTDDGVTRFPDVQEGDNDAPYSGSYVNAKVRFWAQDDKEYGKRINCSIEAVQFAKHGEAFGGGARTNVDDEFDEEDVDDTDDMDTTSSGKSKSQVDDDLDI